MARIVAPVGKGFQDERYRQLISTLVAKRKELKLSQEALAQRLGRHQQFVSRYEIGERRLDIVEYIDVARVLRIDPAEQIAALA